LEIKDYHSQNMKIATNTYSLMDRLIGLIKLMRPKQWVKNGFVFAPLVFSGEMHNPDALIHAFLAASLFCVASSATYIVNDIHDIDLDRQHPRKSKSRPLAAGIITKNVALALMLALYFILALGYLVMPKVILVITAYLVLNLAYTFILKHEPVIDIFTIAISFVLRVIAGAAALDLGASAWMCVTTLCLALYLAAVKRRQELAQSGTEGRKVLKKYSVALVDRYAEMSATGALLFYSMFVMSTRPALVITIPLVLYGLFRYWYVVEALDGGESPTDALFADWQLMAVVALWIATCVWALSGMHL
jgi:decaprenyl-phosphate phosphoribosyltransferase